MGGELVTVSPDDPNKPNDKTKTYGEVFEELCPWYLSIGMSYDEYWNGPSEIARFYRQAYRLQEKRTDYNAWIQGRYIYEAIGALSPILRTNLSKHEAKAGDYVEKPYLVLMEERKKDEAEKMTRAEKNHQLRMMAYMDVFTDAWNKKFAEKQKAKEQAKAENPEQMPIPS